MKRLIALLSAFSASILLTSCASFTHLTRTRTAHNGQQIMTYADAKQRVVVSSVRHSDDGNGKDLAICAEPSPDALSAIAASQGFSLSQQEIETAFNNALAESAGSIGLRTQSIQLMRDSMYRLCEAHMSGAIGDLAFETLHRRFQSSMVAILAIEQLTGTVKARQIALGTNAAGGNAELVAKYTDLTENRRSQLQQAQQSLASAETDLKTKQDDYDTAVKQANEADENPDDELTPDEKATFDAEKAALDDAKARVETAKATVSNRQADFDSANAARLAAISGEVSASAVATLSADGSTSISDTRINAVSDAVQAIVESTLELSFSNELCTTVLVAAADGELDNNGFDPAADERVLLASIVQQTSEASGERQAWLSVSNRLRAELEAAARNRQRALENLRRYSSIEERSEVEQFELERAREFVARYDEEIPTKERELGDALTAIETYSGQIESLQKQAQTVNTSIDEKYASSVPGRCVELLNNTVERQRAITNIYAQIDAISLLNADAQTIEALSKLLEGDTMIFRGDSGKGREG